MPRPRVYKTKAVVLRHRKLGEADLILTLYSPELGKLDAVAKGARKPTSRLAGHLEALSHTNVMLAQGKSLDVVTQSQTIEAFRAFWEDLERMSRAVYVAELVDKSTPEQQPNRALYELLLQTLRYLAETAQIDVVVRWFEVQALTVLGYRPRLDRCVRCQADLTPVANYFSAVAGGVICHDCVGNGLIVRPLSLNALKILRLMQHSYVEQVLRVRIDGPLADEIEGHLREYLYTVLEREMKSTSFLQVLKREALAGT